MADGGEEQEARHHTVRKLSGEVVGCSSSDGNVGLALDRKVLQL